MDHSILVARGESDKRPVPVVPVILIPIVGSGGYNSTCRLLFFLCAPKDGGGLGTCLSSFLHRKEKQGMVRTEHSHAVF